MKGLAGKVAIITGGATSIGAAITRAFHAAGTRVVIADIDDSAGTALARDRGPGALFHRTDVAIDAQIKDCLGATVATFGALNFLINNACVYLDNGLSSSRAEWLTAFNINVVGGAIFAREAVPYMRGSGGGAIVNFSSIAARHGQRGRAVYPACKAANLQVTRNEAMELASDRIRVNTIVPGWTWSAPIERLARGDRSKADRVAGEYHPLGRLGNADDVANAVLFLCSDDAGHITGIELPVDGGYSMTGPDQGTPRQSRLGE